MTEKFEVDNSTIRSKEQYEATRHAAEAGCAWCLPDEEQKSPLLKRFSLVDIRENAFPKPGRRMLLIILRRHASLGKIKTYEAEEFFGALNWLISELKLSGGGVILRFGDKKFNASSLPDSHLFWSVVVPDGTQPVAETLFKDTSPEKVQTREERAKSFTES